MLSSCFCNKTLFCRKRIESTQFIFAHRFDSIRFALISHVALCVKNVLVIAWSRISRGGGKGWCIIDAVRHVVKRHWRRCSRWSNDSEGRRVHPRIISDSLLPGEGLSEQVVVTVHVSFVWLPVLLNLRSGILQRQAINIILAHWAHVWQSLRLTKWIRIILKSATQVRLKTLNLIEQITRIGIINRMSHMGQVLAHGF